MIFAQCVEHFPIALSQFRHNGFPLTKEWEEKLNTGKVEGILLADHVVQCLVEDEKFGWEVIAKLDDAKIKAELAVAYALLPSRIVALLKKMAALGQENLTTVECKTVNKVIQIAEKRGLIRRKKITNNSRVF